MKIQQKIFLTSSVICLGFIVGVGASAHQPRLVSEQTNLDGEMQNLINVENPDISQAFYGELTGQEQWFQIESSDPNFVLYVNLLVPKIENIEKDVSALIISEASNENQGVIAELNGLNFQWSEFYEPFGGDTYYMGPEFNEKVGTGTYLIKVYSPDNLGKYVVAIGQIESFPIKEQINTLRLLPTLKHDFFNKSPWTALFNYVGLFILILVVGLVVTIFFFSWIIKKILRAKRRR